MIAGGWTIVDPVGVELPEKIAAGFVEATEKLAGVRYEPYAYCASQVVNGTNYMLVCKASLAADPPIEKIAALYLHEDLPVGEEESGEFSVMGIEEIELGIL